MSQLTVINRLHQSRLEAVEKQLRAAALALEKEEHNVASRKEALEEQQRNAALEEAAIYKRLFRNTVRRSGLDDAMVDVQAIRNKTVTLETALLEAQQGLDRARIAHEQAQTRHRDQFIKLEKYASLLDSEKEAAKAAASHAEDAALDEVVELAWKRHAY